MIELDFGLGCCFVTFFCDEFIAGTEVNAQANPCYIQYYS